MLMVTLWQKSCPKSIAHAPCPASTPPNPSDLSMLPIILKKLSFRHAGVLANSVGEDDYLRGAVFAAGDLVHEQCGQLDRLERLASLHNIRLGIIPLEVRLPTADNPPFVLYNNRQLNRALPDTEIVSRHADDIATYANLFAALGRTADYGDGA